MSFKINELNVFSFLEKNLELLNGPRRDIMLRTLPKFEDTL